MLRAPHLFIRGTVLLSCAWFASSAAAQTCVDPPLGLHGWWPGDGDSVDLRSGLHAVAVNGAAYGPGLVGDAFDFNGFDQGRDDHVDLPPAALSGLADFTVEMWVMSQGEQGAFISGAGPTLANAGTDNELLLLHGIGGGLAIARQQHAGNFPDFWSDGAWHHLAFVRSGGHSVLYVDGLIVDVQPVPTAPLEIGPGGLMLGQEQDCLGGCLDPEQALDGMIDELSIYDRALSSGEITAIVDAGAAGKCKPASRDDLLREIEDLQADNFDLETELVNLDSELIGLESEVVDLESEVETLLGRVADLEATSCEEPEPEPEVCEHGHRWRGDEHDQRHHRRWHHRRDWRRWNGWGRH